MIGATIKNYKIIEKLGEGGMGVVYKAEDTKLIRTVALKFLSRELTYDEKAKQRFMQEAQAASALDHPNICTIHEIDETEMGQMFIVMTHYEGQSLKEKIDHVGANSGAPMPIDNAINYAIQIAQGLSRTHEAGIMHRDMKPGNIMVTDRGEVKIVDFGLAKLAGHIRPTDIGSSLGTVAYLSPEQSESEKTDERADIWALGVILYEMLTGQKPFQGEADQVVIYSIVNEEPKAVSELRPEVPAKLERITNKALAKDPQARYASCADLLADLKTLREDAAPLPQSLRKLLRQPRFAIPAILIIAVLCFFAVRFYYTSAKIKWTRSTALPEIASLVDDKKFGAALNLARQAERYIPDDPLLQKLLQSCSIPVSIKTTPPGAEVYYRDYLSVDADWEYLGRTPVDSVRAQIGYLRWKIVRDGYETVESAFGGWWPLKEDFKLHASGAGPANMVHVPGGRFKLFSAAPVKLPEYWIDKYEVTNKAYRAFVVAGGYQKPVYWKHPFVMQDRTLSREEAMLLLRDKTGQPGPSTWELGRFPEGQADHPVGGISWYEAVAYAEFAGKSLPTIYHWKKAAFGRQRISSDAVVLSNFKREGPAGVGQFQGVAGFGAYDMAGNVKEWCWNQAGNRRYILGGAWHDPEYGFTAAQSLMPFDRSATNGFRCVRYSAELAPKVTDAIEHKSFSRDLTREKPVEDDIFDVYKGYFLYDATDLNAVVESVDESREHWRYEIVTFDAAYGEERVIAHLYLPRNAVAPYQAVIYYPSDAAFNLSSSDNLAEMALMDFVPRTGRALVLPVYKGMFERRVKGGFSGIRDFVDQMIQQVKDYSRTIDYLQTREDIDTNRLAYMGTSGGGARGPVFTAVEKRLKASVLLWGGLWPFKLPDEVAPINFAPRSRTPVLMINGRYDSSNPLEISQQPLFRLLGAPEKDKRHAIISGGHVTPMNEVIKETLAWMDRYLGPVQRRVQRGEK